MYLTPLKCSPMTVRTLRALMGLNRTAQPSRGLPSPMPMGPGSQGWSHDSLSQWCHSSACPPLPTFLLYLAMGLMSLPGLGLSSFPWRCPMPKVWSASRCSLLCSLRQGDQHWLKSPALPASTLIPELDSLQEAIGLCLSHIHCEKYNAYEQSIALHLTRSVIFPISHLE